MLRQKSQQGEGLTRISSIHKQIVKAADTMSINECDDKQLKQLFLMVAKFIGIKSENLPDPLTSTMLRSAVRNHYSNYTVGDFTAAFELSIMGKLNVDTRHFQSFDAPYIKRIMDAYAKKRFDVMNHISKQKQLEERPSTDEKEQHKIMKEGVLQYFDDFRSGNAGKYLKVSIYFSFLNQESILNITESNIKVAKDLAGRMLMRESEAKIEASVDRGKIKQMKTFVSHLIDGDKSISEKINERAKEIMLHKFFNDIIARGMELSEMFEPEAI